MTSSIKTYILIDLERYKQLEAKNKQLQALSEKYSKLQDLLVQRDHNEAKGSAIENPLNDPSIPPKILPSKIQKSSSTKMRKPRKKREPPLPISADQAEVGGGKNDADEMTTHQSVSNLEKREFLQNTLEKQKNNLPKNWWSVL